MIVKGFRPDIAGEEVTLRFEGNPSTFFEMNAERTRGSVRHLSGAVEYFPIAGTFSCEMAHVPILGDNGYVVAYCAVADIFTVNGRRFVYRRSGDTR
jgi:hypothetical protein